MKMGQPRIALLNAAHAAADTRRNFRRELDADVAEFHCPSGEFPEGFRYDGFVVTGSRASVYCYGHQLLADVLGGSVESMGEYEIGYRTVEQDGDNRLLEGVSEEMTVFTTHSDHVQEAPPGATVFARNEYGVHGFRKDHAFAVQFHPEYDMETAESVTRGKDGELPAERIEAVIDGIHADNYEAACEAKVLFDNFLEYVEELQLGRIGAD